MSHSKKSLGAVGSQMVVEVAVAAVEPLLAILLTGVSGRPFSFEFFSVGRIGLRRGVTERRCAVWIAVWRGLRWGVDGR